MEQLAFWCASSFMFMLAITLMIFALLRHAPKNLYDNKRIAELDWQARNRNTDWWLEVNNPDRQNQNSE